MPLSVENGQTQIKKIRHEQIQGAGIDILKDTVSFRNWLIST